MRNTNKLIGILLVLLTALSCSEDDSVEALKPESIILSASSTILKADGKDEVNFEVEVLDENMNLMEDTEYEFYANGERLNAASFKTNERGDYKVMARIGDLESNLIVLKALSPEDLASSLKISASSSSVLADGEDAVTFEVEVLDEDENKVEDASYNIFINGEKLDSLSFSTTTSGDYEVVAKLAGLESNVLVLEAINPDDLAASISISASSTSVLADGIETISFEVEVLDEKQEIIQNTSYQIFVNEEKLEADSFSTIEAGEYKVVARINDLESNELVITAYTPEDLVASLSLETNTQLIIANGKSSAAMVVKSYDENYRELFNVDYELLVNGLSYENSSFYTLQSGDYEVVAKVKNVESNSVNITVREPRIYEEVSIPVIFHVVHFGGDQPSFFPERVIHTLNAGLSNQYRSTNPNAVDTQIRFRLAILDPENNPLPESGVNRIDGSFYDVGSPAEKRAARVMPIPRKDLIADYPVIAAVEADIPNDQRFGYDETYAMGQANTWDREDYYNVYVLPVQDDNLGGYAYLPFVRESLSFEGFTVYNGPSENIDMNEVCVVDVGSIYSKVIIHEVGHSLGLPHNFSEDNCVSSDYCEDTLSYDINNFLNPCQGNRGLMEYDNHMDYRGLSTTFTYDQRERMRHVMEYGHFFSKLKYSNK